MYVHVPVGGALVSGLVPGRGLVAVKGGRVGIVEELLLLGGVGIVPLSTGR